MIPCIYKITCLPTGKFYIGSTSDYNKRMRMHFRQLSLGVHRNSHLQNAYNKYGKEFFYIEAIELVVNKHDLLSREKHWFQLTRCYDREVGFNICINPANSLGVKRTEEFKEKIRIANNSRSQELKNRITESVKLANTGRVPWNRGLKMWTNKDHPRGNKGKKNTNRKPISESGYRNLCEANRRPKTEEYLKKRSQISSKSYRFIEPKTGSQVDITNLSKFCDRFGLNKTRMYQVAKGNEPSHRGWIGVQFIPPAIRYVTR